jgi:DNA modification methylase
MSARNEQKGVYNWFPFFQAFTSSFLEKVFNRREMKESRKILDPFVGSGNTLVACVEFGRRGYGFDVNPLFQFIARVKTREYSSDHFEKAEKIVWKAMNNMNTDVAVEFPQLSSFQKLFNPEILEKLMILRNTALEEENEESASLLLFALASGLLSFSWAKRYGKGLHVNEKPCEKEVEKLILNKLRKMRIEYAAFRGSSRKLGSAHVVPNSILEVEKTEKVPMVDAVITSPPYCNSSDYVEMYKLELWFLGYVTRRSEFKELSYRTVRSHLSFNDSRTKWSHPAIDAICNALETMELWNSRLPMMIRGYFDDVHSSLAKIGARLKDNGKVILVIGNSSYEGVVIPSDLLLAEAAEDLEFRVETIEVARNLSPSPQQKKMMDEHSGSLMRESIVILSK